MTSVNDWATVKFDDKTCNNILISLGDKDLIKQVEDAASNYLSSIAQLEKTTGEIKKRIIELNKSAKWTLENLNLNDQELDLLQSNGFDIGKDDLNLFEDARKIIRRIERVSRQTMNSMKTIGRPTDEPKELFIYQLGIIWNCAYGHFPWNIQRGKKCFYLFVDETSSQLGEDLHIKHDSRILKTFLDKRTKSKK